MDGLAAARRAVASAEVASLSGGSITATTTARPRRRRCLAISTMGLRWPTPRDGNNTNTALKLNQALLLHTIFKPKSKENWRSYTAWNPEA
uniref:Uncharacterized protein n=1 Tax=Oryza barthii TaxID=65489 RepID=A0A0D3FR74_9ORYZ